MDYIDRTNVQTPCNNDQCMLCKLTRKVHSLTSQDVIAEFFQNTGHKIQTFGETVIEYSATVYHHGVSTSRALRTLTENTRSLIGTVKDYAVIFILYGLVAVLFALLFFMPLSPKNGGEVTLLFLLFPVIFIILPSYCWIHGLFDLFKASLLQDIHEPCSTSAQMMFEKPPEYESLLSSFPSDVSSSVAPPAYADAMCNIGVPRILQPDCSGTNIVVPLCSVHQCKT